MMAIELTPEEQAIYDRNTYHGPLPQRSEPPKAVEPTRHPLAGNRPGVRNTSRKALNTVKLSDDEHQVYIALKMHDRSLCDAELLAYLKASTTKGDKWEINQVTGRRHSLLTKGLIEEHNRRKCSHSTTVATIHWAVAEDAR